MLPSVNGRGEGIVGLDQSLHSSGGTFAHSRWVHLISHMPCQPICHTFTPPIGELSRVIS